MGAASLFGVAALLKLGRLGDFRAELDDYGLVPDQLLLPFALIVPAAELAGAVLTFVPTTHALGGAVLFGLLAIFSAAVVVNLQRGQTSIRCACLGQFSKRLTWAIPLRNGLLGASLAAGVAVGTPSIDPAAGAGAILAWVFGWSLVEATATSATLKESTGE